MRLPKQAEPVSHVRSSANAYVGRVGPSGEPECTLCKIACDQLSGVARQLCLLACQQTVC